MNKDLVELYSDEAYRPMIVPPTGNAKTKIALDDALSSGVSFMVMPKWNLFIIDSDTLVRTFTYKIYKDYLIERKIPFYEWNSGRPGHRHLVAAFAKSKDQQHAWELIKRLKLDLRHHRMTRPTLAPHKNGLPVSLCEGYTLQDVERTLSVHQPVTWLRPPDFTQGDDEITNGLPAKYIKQYTLDLIRNGTEEGCPDRSSVINSIANSLANSNYSIDDGAKLLADPTNKISKHILERRKTPETRLEYARTFMRKAWRFVNSNPSNHSNNNSREAKLVKIKIAQIFNLVTNLPWSGQKGNSEFSCLQAHLRTAARAGSFVYGLSVREQELVAGLSMMTLRKANERLIEKGWLRKLGKPEKDQAQAWELSVPESHLLALDAIPYCLNARECANLETLQLGGIFRAVLVDKQRGLGKTAGRIYAQIKLGKMEINDLVKATGLSRVTVWRALQRLQSAEMITKDRKLTGMMPEFMVESADRKEKAIRTRQEREREAWKDNQIAYEIGKLKAA